MNEEYERNMKKTQKIDKILKNEKFNKIEICDGILSDSYITYKENGKMPKICTISLEKGEEIKTSLNSDNGVVIQNIQASEYVIIGNIWIPRDNITDMTFSYEDENVKDDDNMDGESERNREWIEKDLRNEGFDNPYPYIYTTKARKLYSCTVMLYKSDHIKIDFDYDESVIIDNSKDNFLRIHNTWIPKESILMLYFDYEDEDED